MKLKFNSNTIIGSIIGDIVGSIYEWRNTKDYNFDIFPSEGTFTDDSVLTVAIADSILHQKDFEESLWSYGRKYPDRGYGGWFQSWLGQNNPQPYNSFGNGSGMRVSPVGFAYPDVPAILQKARETAEVTHNHPEGIKGAQAVAAAVFLAKKAYSKTEIKNYIVKTFAYDLNFSIDEIRPEYTFDVTCQGSVPQAIVAFLESTNYEDAIRKAISLGGDSDTIACMTGGMAAAFHKHIPKEFLDYAEERLPEEFIEIINKFEERFGQA
jgi:ADP-ribosylglycohydrolase